MIPSVKVTTTIQISEAALKAILEKAGYKVGNNFTAQFSSGYNDQREGSTPGSVYVSWTET